jgi:hypothetical protein
MVLYLCVLIVFSLRRESLKLILATNPLPRWFCHIGVGGEVRQQGKLGLEPWKKRMEAKPKLEAEGTLEVRKKLA